MRIGVTASLVVLSLASVAGAGAVASAQATDPSGYGVSLDCPANPIASAIDGGSLGEDDVLGAVLRSHAAHALRGARAGASPTEDHSAGRWLGSWCSDGNDPQCAPLAPAPDAPSSIGLGDAPHWLNAGFDLGLAPACPSCAPRAIVDPLAVDVAGGSRGVTRSLDRPPRTV